MMQFGRHPDWTGDDSRASNARRVLPRLVAEFFEMGRQVCAREPSPSELHRLRLAGKRLRYCLELFRECYGPGLRKRLKRLRRIQRRLGAVSDCDATEQLLRSHHLADGVDGKQLLDFLQTSRDENREAFLQYWRTGFDAPEEERAWIDFLRSLADGSSTQDSAR